MIKDELEKLIREEVGSARVKTDARIGIVSEALVSGNVDVVIDGRVIRTRNPYRAVKGQEVALMPDDRGGFSSALPLRPPVPTVQFEKPPFFSGGVPPFRFGGAFNAVGSPGNPVVVALQDAGSRTLFRLDTTVEVGTLVALSFSPNGKKVLVAVAVLGTPGNAVVQVYQLGPNLKSAGVFDEGDEIDFLQIDKLKELNVSVPGQPFPEEPGQFTHGVVLDDGTVFYSLRLSRTFPTFDRPERMFNEGGTQLIEVIGNLSPLARQINAITGIFATPPLSASFTVDADLGGLTSFAGGISQATDSFIYTTTKNTVPVNAPNRMVPSKEYMTSRYPSGSPTEFTLVRQKRSGGSISEIFFPASDKFDIRQVISVESTGWAMTRSDDDGFVDWRLRKVSIDGSNATLNESATEIQPDPSDPTTIRLATFLGQTPQFTVLDFEVEGG